MQVRTESSFVWVLQRSIILWVYFLCSPLLSVIGSPVTGRPGPVSVTDLSGARLVTHFTVRVYERDPHLLPWGFCDWLSCEPATECDRPWLPLCCPHGSKCEVASTSSSHIWNMSSVTSFSSSSVSTAAMLGVLQEWVRGFRERAPKAFGPRISSYFVISKCLEDALPRFSPSL